MEELYPHGLLLGMALTGAYIAWRGRDFDWEQRAAAVMLGSLLSIVWPFTLFLALAIGVPGVIVWAGLNLLDRAQ